MPFHLNDSLNQDNAKKKNRPLAFVCVHLLLRSPLFHSSHPHSSDVPPSHHHRNHVRRQSPRAFPFQPFCGGRRVDPDDGEHHWLYHSRHCSRSGVGGSCVCSPRTTLLCLLQGVESSLETTKDQKANTLVAFVDCTKRKGSDIDYDGLAI